MGNKTNKQTSSYGFLKPSIRGIHKKTYGSSRVGKKAKEMVKKNLSLFLKGINLQQMINYSTTNDPSSSSSSSLFNKSNSSANFFTDFSIKSNQNKLAANEIDDEQSHQAVSSSVNQEFALHASPSWQYVASTIGEPRFPHVDALPRTWKDSLTADQKNSYSFTAKQMKYQELVYEIILTEQSYVDDLILVYKIFIKEALQWDGLPSAVRNLFENIFQIIRLHMQLLRELRAKQLAQYPVISSITDICRSYVSRFDIYSAYFSNFEKANNIIAESIRVQDEFGSFISRRSLWRECRNLPLTAYLLTPIQRVMKYPLFFKSLSECLSDADGDMENIECFLMEMDVVLRYFEKQKKESEDFIKLEDLASRISGLEGSTVRIAEYGRRLIYEGYLTIIPGTQQNLATRFDSSSNVSFSSAVHPPPLSRRNSSFSLSSARKQKRTYVFLFNDMIVCTRERNKRRMSVVDNKTMAPPPRKGSYYGPSADTLFKITHTPGRITLVDRAVMRPAASSERLSRRGSALFQSLRRYGSRSQEESYPPAPSDSSASANDLSFSVPYYGEQPPLPASPQQQTSSITYEKHPTQFICSIATKNLTNIQFEAETPEEKDMWCSHLESVLGEHVQRNCQQQEKRQSYISNDKDATTGAAYQRATLSPTQSSYSFESNSSNESLAFSSVAWNGYCDIEKMDIDDETQHQRQQKTALNPPIIIDKNKDIMSSIMDEFGDSIWSIGAPAGLSPYQLRKTFSNIGTPDV